MSSSPPPRLPLPDCFKVRPAFICLFIKINRSTVEHNAPHASTSCLNTCTQTAVQGFRYIVPSWYVPPFLLIARRYISWHPRKRVASHGKFVLLALTRVLRNLGM